MKQIALYTLTSSLHAEAQQDAQKETFITDIEASLGQKFLFRGNDFSDFGTHDKDIIYVRTGGTEGLFKALKLSGHILLLTSGKSNSLAASMEILSYIRKNGGRSEILHGSPESIAQRILSETSTDESAEIQNLWVRPLPKIDFNGARLGVIGKPSDWLISSDVDYSKAKSLLGLELVDIPMEELLDELEHFKGDSRSFEGSVAIYEALKVLVQRHSLSGLTLRCFDLLDSFHNTGCLALARLNADGIPSSCEGDVPALITMMIAQKQYSCPGFQCNLSRINGDEFLFAHCTVPLSMVESYRYDTHFESGIGTAIKAEIPAGPAHILKVAPDLSGMVDIPAEIIRNQSEQCLCRTQIIVKAPGAAQYFLTGSFANHHIVALG